MLNLLIAYFMSELSLLKIKKNFIEFLKIKGKEERDEGEEEEEEELS